MGRRESRRREEPGKDVAEAGNEADDAIDAEADFGAGNAEGLVEEKLDLLEGGVAEEPGAAIPAAWLLNDALRENCAWWARGFID